MCVCVCVCVRRMCRYRLVWSNTDLQATNTTIKMDCAPGGHETRILNI